MRNQTKPSRSARGAWAPFCAWAPLLSLLFGCREAELQPPESGDFIVTIEGVPAETTQLRAISVRNQTQPDPRSAAWQDLAPDQTQFYLRPMVTATNPHPLGTLLRVVALADGNPCVIAYGEATLTESDGARNVTVTLKPEPGDPMCRMLIPDNVARIRGLWGSAEDNIWGAGESTSGMGSWAVHYDGKSWKVFDAPPANATMYAIDGSSANDIWAAGNGGNVFRFNGSAWASVATGITNQAYGDIYVRAPNDVWFASTAGGVVRYNGTSFSRVGCNGVTYRFWTVWSPSASSPVMLGGFATDQSGITSAGLFQVSGTTCSQLLNLTAWGPRRIRGLSTTDILVVGAGSLPSTYMVSGRSAEALSYNGTTFSGVIPATGEYLRDIWGGQPAGPNEYWAVGERGAIVKGSGAMNWSAVENSATDYIYSVWGTPTHLFMGGDLFIHRYRLK